jgi:hypothetical protein
MDEIKKANIYNDFKMLLDEDEEFRKRFCHNIKAYFEWSLIQFLKDEYGEKEIPYFSKRDEFAERAIKGWLNNLFHGHCIIRESLKNDNNNQIIEDSKK